MPTYRALNPVSVGAVNQSTGEWFPAAFDNSGLLRLSGFGILAAPAPGGFTRPADTTAYAAGDLIANSTTAGSVVPLEIEGVTVAGDGGAGVISSVLVQKGGAAAALLRAHFFAAAPAVANGDNGALSVTPFDLADYVGFLDVSCSDPVAGGALGLTQGQGLEYVLAEGDSLFVLLEALAAFTPVSEAVFNVAVRLRRYA